MLQINYHGQVIWVACQQHKVWIKTSFCTNCLIPFSSSKLTVDWLICAFKWFSCVVTTKQKWSIFHCIFGVENWLSANNSNHIQSTDIMKRRGSYSLNQIWYFTIKQSILSLECIEGHAGFLNSLSVCQSCRCEVQNHRLM